MAERQERDVLHLRRLADQQHGQHHERRPVQAFFADYGTSLNWPGTNQTADQLKDAQNSAAWAGTTPYYDPTAFAEVRTRRSGNTGYNILRGPGLFNWDFESCRILLSRPRQAAFRVEAFNFTNTPHLAIPDNDVGDGRIS